MNNFKKILLSVFVVAAFVIYAVYQKTSTSVTYNASSTNSSNTSLVKDNNALTDTNTSPLPASGNSISSTKAQSAFKDGEYTGISADAYFGNVEVKAVISGGKLSDVVFLDYPQDRNASLRISQNAMPILKSEAIQTQSANVDAVSGATQTSAAFNQSLASALLKAKN